MFFHACCERNAAGALVFENKGKGKKKKPKRQKDFGKENKRRIKLR